MVLVSPNKVMADSTGRGGPSMKEKRPRRFGYRLPCLARSTAKTSPNVTDSNALTTMTNISNDMIALLSIDMVDLRLHLVLPGKTATQGPAV
jgi:hypothetical protein